MPIDGDELRIELAKAAAEVAAQCAASLAELGLLMPHRSEDAEKSVRRMADLCRQGSAQVAETVFLRCADEIARWRAELPPPVRERD